jgi:beta-glucosidase
MSNVKPLGKRFPASFVFGVSTSAFQIEGSSAADGKGPSIWDTFCKRRGAIQDGSTGDVACDHFRLWKQDVELMRFLGLDTYRFSIAWPRIQPTGEGAVNTTGLAFYDRLVDGLLGAGIAPFVTLYHWDLPQALQERGGWGSRETASRFADYAGIVARGLGDRVRHFITLNEPWMFTFVGHLMGWHPPGKHNPWLAMRVLHTCLLGHGMAVDAIKSERPEAEVGISLSLSPVEPATQADRDRLAAQRADLFMNRMLLDPLLRGRYPDEASFLRLFFPRFHDGDFEIINRHMDFLGVNTYTRERARYARNIPVLHFWTDAGDIPETDFVRDGAQYTDMGSEVYPPALRLVLKRIRDEYDNIPVYITENGASFADEVQGEQVHDPKRVAFLESYLDEAAKALDEGCALKGYSFWSLLDNMEWSFGYKKKLGLVHVDFATQKRTVKDSGFRYRQIIAEHKETCG